MGRAMYECTEFCNLHRVDAILWLYSSIDTKRRHHFRWCVVVVAILLLTSLHLVKVWLKIDEFFVFDSGTHVGVDNILQIANFHLCVGVDEYVYVCVCVF